MRIRTTLLALVIGMGSACRSTEPALHDLYRGSLEELAGPKGVSTKSRERNVKRFESVRKQLASGRVTTAEDHLFAAGTLSTSDEMADLELARELAARASDLGEPLGRIFVAETTDKILVQQGKRQHYGTQLYLDVASRQWHLYPSDPLTSDKERAEMGLPSFAEMLRLVDERNQQAGLADAVIDAVEAD